MIVKMPDYFREFKCVAGECPDSCCDGWKIKIDEKTAEKYRKHDGVLANRIKKYFTDENYFILDESRCPFLNKENMCDIYIKMGKDALSNVCSFYPRRIQVLGNVMYAGMNLSCPEIVRLIFERKNGIKYIKYDDGKETGEKIDTDSELLLVEIEEIFHDIINDRRFSWKKRMMMCIFIADEIQKNCDFDLLAEYKSKTFQLAQALPDEEKVSNNELKESMLRAILQEYGKICEGRKHDSFTTKLLEKISADFELAKVAEKDYEPYMYQFENYVTCCLFRYITECKCTDDVFDMMVRICTGYSVIKELYGQCLEKYGELTSCRMIDIMHYYCKITEHSQKDYEKINSLIKNLGYDDMAHMMILI